MAATLFCTTSASASVTITSFNAVPSTTVAAAHPNFTTSFQFSYSSASDDVKSTVVALPPGLVGNPSAPAKCTTAQLNADSCPGGSIIGSVSSTATQDALPLLPPVTATGDVYNVAPTGSEPARVGMVIRPLGGVLGKLITSGPASVRIPGDFGLTTTFDNLPRTLPLLGGGLPVGIQIQGISLTLNGLAPGGTRAFLTNPTSCIAATTTATGTSYESSTPSVRTSAFTPTDCAHVPFNPSPFFGPLAVRAGKPEGVAAGVSQPSTEFPRSQAHIRTSTVLLPQGTAVNGARLAGIAPCTDAQLNVNSAAPATCPANSQVGFAYIDSPLVGPKIGPVYFGAGTPTAPLRQFVTVPITATQTAKFIAINTFAAGGVIQTTLTDLPQTPASTFMLIFPGGPTPPSLLISPPTCGNHFGAAVFNPWSGQSSAGAFFNQKVVKTTTGADCPAAAAARTFAAPSSAVPNDAKLTAPASKSVPKRLRPLLRQLKVKLGG